MKAQVTRGSSPLAPGSSCLPTARSSEHGRSDDETPTAEQRDSCPGFRRVCAHCSRAPCLAHAVPRRDVLPDTAALVFTPKGPHPAAGPQAAHT